MPKLKERWVEASTYSHSVFASLLTNSPGDLDDTGRLSMAVQRTPVDGGAEGQNYMSFRDSFLPATTSYSFSFASVL